MTNYEKYKNEIVEIASQMDLETGYIAVDRDTGKPVDCSNVKFCSDCSLNSINSINCSVSLLEWAASEAKGEKMNDKNTGGIASVAVTQVPSKDTTAKSNKEILQRAIDTYGIDNQMQQTIEEMAELTQAICKHKRAGSKLKAGDPSSVTECLKTYANLVEETADCLIMLEQMRIAIGDDVNGVIEEKIERLGKRLNEREQTE